MVSFLFLEHNVADCRYSTVPFCPLSPLTSQTLLIMKSKEALWRAELIKLVYFGHLWHQFIVLLSVWGWNKNVFVTFISAFRVKQLTEATNEWLISWTDSDHMTDEISLWMMVMFKTVCSQSDYSFSWFIYWLIWLHAFFFNILELWHSILAINGSLCFLYWAADYMVKGLITQALFEWIQSITIIHNHVFE